MGKTLSSIVSRGHCRCFYRLSRCFVFLSIPRFFHSVLKVLESATASNHGSDSYVGMSSSSSMAFLSKRVPLWMKFDEHSRLKKDFINEMRLLSRLRHPCITTVMVCLRICHWDDRFSKNSFVSLGIALSYFFADLVSLRNGLPTSSQNRELSSILLVTPCLSWSSWSTGRCTTYSIMRL